MSDYYKAKRDFEYLAQSEQPAYLVRHSTSITTNAGTFPLIPFNGGAVNTMALSLLTKYSLRHASDLGMANYEAQLALCVSAMLENYDYVDLTAEGSDIIIEKAGVDSYAGSSTRTAPPSAPRNVVFSSKGVQGEIVMKMDFDDLSYGAIAVHTTDPTVGVFRSADMQLKVVAGDAIIFIDLMTARQTTIKNQIKGTTIIPTVALFNPNGLSPIVKPEPPIISQ